MLKDFNVSDYFSPKQDLLNMNKKMRQDIQRTNSVCLSVCRGNFESSIEVKKL